MQSGAERCKPLERVSRFTNPNQAYAYEFCGRDGRCVLLVPLAPLAHLAWALLRLLAFGRSRPYKLTLYCFWTSIMALGGDADQICTI